ncbi:uncharacterized protein LOC129721763 isoform X2 [Wyeomyia smithii]|uniref:uncharacterized protein LOC129721763 isoform X2 n=1 Tax=Wyeomyia smithii TaxID=174621 RepID=UPI0024680E35|nr:uncharacterized protein LOC129721763 isoform X2 [Wyeomyia smithii]
MRCVIPGCRSDESVSLHRIPNKEAMRERWFNSINKALGGGFAKLCPNFDKGRICAKHFKPSCFSAFGTKTRLLNTAIPTLFEDEEGNLFETEQSLHCAVQGCDHDGINFDGITSHMFPLDVKECKAWVRFANNANAINQYIAFGPAGVRKWRMCSQHFELSWFKFPNKGRTCPLKPGAIPTLAPPPSGATPAQFVRPSGAFGRLSNPKISALSKPQEKQFVAKDGEVLRVTFKSHSQQTAENDFMPPSVPVPMKYRDACRLCFSTVDLEPLYSGLIVVREELLDRIYLSTGVLIIPRPKESAHICTRCAETINTFFTFRQQVNSNNVSFLQRKTTDDAIARHKIMKQVRKRRINIPPTAVQPKLERKAPEPLRVEFVAKNTVPRPQPEPIPNPLDCEVEIKQEPEECLIEADPVQLNMTVEGETPSGNSSIITVDLSEDLPEQVSWTCQHCNKIFLFKFECAKHLLQEHHEKVSVIKALLNLDELNTNILEVMSGQL